MSYMLNILTGLTGFLLVGVILAIAFGALIGALELFAVFANFYLRQKRRKFRNIQTNNGCTLRESVRIFLDSNDMKDVQIQIAGFWRNLFFGCHYNPKKNIFFMGKRIAESRNLADTSLGIQRVAKAINYRHGSKRTKRAIRMQTVIPFATFLIVPIILLGVLVDYLVYSDFATPNFSIIACIICLILFIILAIMSFQGIKIEKNANRTAIDIMEQSKFLTDDEMEEVKKVYKWRVIAYVVNLIISIIRILQLILKILCLFAKKKK